MNRSQGPFIAERYPPVDFGMGLNDPDKVVAQTFQLDVFGKLTGVAVFLEEQIQDSNGSLFVDILEVNAGVIGALPLSSVELPHGYLPPNSGDLVTIPFLSPPIDVQPGVELAIQFRVGANGYYGIGGSDGSRVLPYDKGKLYMRHPVTTGNAWQAMAHQNVYFQALVVTEEPPGPVPTPAPLPPPEP